MNQIAVDCSSSDDEATEQTKLIALHIQNERSGCIHDPAVIAIPQTLSQGSSNTVYSPVGDCELDKSKQVRESHNRVSGT